MDNETVVLVEFSRGKPFSVVTKDADGHYSHYDFAWCKRDEVLLYENCGGGLYLEHGDHKYWLADGEPEPCDGGGYAATGKRLKRMPKRWPRSKLSQGDEEQIIYCSKCDDHLPAPGWSNNVCEHIRWCEECSCWGGEGYTEGGCKCSSEMKKEE